MKSNSMKQLYGGLRNIKNVSTLRAAFRNLFAFYRCHEIPGPPLAVAWELTNACDSRCAYCRTHELKAIYGEPSRNDALAIAENIGRSGVKTVNLSGGEPLLSEHLFPVIETLRRFGVEVVLSTNGSRLAELASELGRAGVSVVTIGMNGASPQTHNAASGRDGLYETIESAISTIRQKSVDGFPIRLRMLVTPTNFREVFFFAKQWRGRVDEICFQPIHHLGLGHPHCIPDSTGAFTDEMREPLTSEIKKLISTFPEFDNHYYKMIPDFIFSPATLKNSFPCVVPALAMRLSSNGNATLCSDAKTVVGNLATQELMEVWTHPDFRDLRCASRRLNRDCLCWIQPMRMNFIVPQFLHKIAKSSIPAAKVKILLS